MEIAFTQRTLHEQKSNSVNLKVGEIAKDK
jgi:hypothetical protein